ncbi:MAG: hypothetical protein FVQ82_07800 [Planctomycetes bacterium]|nr:hypothetical protein [Planctomycetota bacterium]
MQILSAIQNGKWSPGIGDPTVIGWLIVAAYITTAMLSGRCAYNARKKQQTKLLTFWLTITIILTLLAINKQLDLQSWLRSTAKQMAREQGWYAHRQIFQMSVVAIIAAVGTGLIVLASWIMRNYRSTRMAFIGLIVLLVFIVIRTASLHSIDEILAIKIAGQKLRYLLELAAIACIAISAAGSLIKSNKTKQ